MEGNFYVSPDAAGQPLRSQLGRAYIKCKVESAAYGKCIEAAHVNKSVKKNLCLAEREQLDACVRAQVKADRIKK